MSGPTNPVSIFVQPDHTDPSVNAAQYKTYLDNAFNVMKRIATNFAPHQTPTPAMTLTLDAGFMWNGRTLTEVAGQVTGTITAPVGNPRIDRVVIDADTGAFLVVTGTPSASPSAPAIPDGWLPVAQVLLQTSTTVIVNSMISDERIFGMLGGTTFNRNNNETVGGV